MPRWQSITIDSALNSEFDPRVFVALRGHLVEQHRRIDLGPCWATTYHLNHHGYGQTNFAGKPWLTHRVAYTVAIGPIPPGLHVLHHCDNRACCRPSHLWLGTDLDNARDRDAKQRRVVRGSQMGAAKLDERTVEVVLDRIEEGESLSSIARSTGVTQPTIQKIKSGTAWTHCGDTERRKRISARSLMPYRRPWAQFEDDAPRPQGDSRRRGGAA